MDDTYDCLDFLDLLDEVEEETVSRLVNEIGPTTASSCELEQNDSLDMLSICDTTSASDAVSSANAQTGTDNITEADDSKMHVRHVLELTTDDLDNRTCFRPMAVENTDGYYNLITAYSCHSDHQSGIHANGQNGCNGKRGRWHFNKWQKEQLDGVFKKTMYPSRWTLTELSTALQVPVHNLRNRRWRFRKTMGLKGDLRTRGSRTMLPQKREGHLKQTSSRLNSQSPVLAGGSRPPTSHMGVFSPQPLKSSLAQSDLSSPSSSASPVYSPVPLYPIPAHQPVYSSVGQHPGTWHWSLSSFSANWNWFTNSPPLSASYPLSHVPAQWQDFIYSQPLLYPLGTDPATLRQTCMRETQETNVVMSSLSCGSSALVNPVLGQPTLCPASGELSMPSPLLYKPQLLLPEHGLSSIGSQTGSTHFDHSVSNICISAACNSAVDSSRPLTSLTEANHFGLTVQNPHIYSNVSHEFYLKNVPGQR